MGTGRSSERLLLERAAELDVIAAAIGATRAGTGSALLIEGAAGIGKTQLLAYACEHAAAAGMTVLTARAACADAVGVLMAEQFVEGELHLRFVHPLVRSAVYQDIAPPVRQQWHKRAARLLAAEGAASAEVTVHLLGSAAEADPWVAGQLRQAASDARGRGAPDVAAQCLERALAEPPTAQARADVLYELGTAQTFRAPAAAVDHLSAALDATSVWPRRGQAHHGGHHTFCRPHPTWPTCQKRLWPG